MVALAIAPSRVLAGTPDAESLLLTGTALDMASMQNDSVMRRTAALRSGVQGVDLAGLNVQAGERRLAGDSLNAVSRPILSPVFDSVLNRGDAARWGAFANGDVRRNGASGDNVGMTTGIDYRFGEHLAVGSSLGYASFGVAPDPGRSFLDVESRRLSLFGTYYRQNMVHVDGLIAYGSTSYDSVRRLDYADAQGIGPAFAKGSASGNQLSGALTSALDLQHGGWRFGPKVGAYYLDVDVGRLSEFGAGAQDLSIAAQTAQSMRLTAGAYLSLALPVPFGVLTPNFNADYVRDNVRSPLVDGQLRADPLSAHHVDPGRIARCAGSRLLRLVRGRVRAVRESAFRVRHLSNAGQRRKRDVERTDVGPALRNEAAVGLRPPLPLLRRLPTAACVIASVRPAR